MYIKINVAKHGKTTRHSFKTSINLNLTGL